MKQVLVIDIGNSTTACGLFQDQALIWRDHAPTELTQKAGDFVFWLTRQLGDRQVNPDGVDRTVVSSVVPWATAAVCAAIQELTGREPILADRHRIGLDLAIGHPETVGTDRLVCALAAVTIHPGPVIVIDLGTCTTISVVDGQRRFVGGSISPGMQTAANALHQATAQLPQVDIAKLARPEENRPVEIPAIGNNTIACIHSGIVQGTAAMIDGLITRMEDQLGSPASRVITGGLASLVKPFCRQTLIHEPNLLLLGLKLLADRD